MRVFLISCAAMILLAVGGYFALSSAQKASGTTYATEGARIKQSWSYRRMTKRTGPETSGKDMPVGDVDGDDCEVPTTWKWITIDFVDSTEEAPTCT